MIDRQELIYNLPKVERLCRDHGQAHLADFVVQAREVLGQACECGDFRQDHPGDGPCKFKDHHIPDPELNVCSKYVRSQPWFSRERLDQEEATKRTALLETVAEASRMFLEAGTFDGSNSARIDLKKALDALSGEPPHG